MTALATVDNLQDRMQGSITDTTRAELILDDVSAAVRAHTRQTITQATTTDRLRVVHGRVTLPQRPATAVSAVADVDGDDVSFEWDGLQRLDVPSRALSQSRFEDGNDARLVVDVTYTHGYADGDPVLDAVAGIVCNIAARVYGFAPEAAGRTQESIGDYSYAVGAMSMGGAYALTAAERRALRDLLGAPRMAGIISTLPGTAI